MSPAMRGRPGDVQPIRTAFQRMDHDHFFEQRPDGGIRMKDVFDYAAPLGPIGRVADGLFLRRDMLRLLESRNEVIKRIAEAVSAD